MSYSCLLLSLSFHVSKFGLKYRWHRAHGDGLLVVGLFFTNYSPSWEMIPLLRTRGYVILWGSRDGSVGSVFDCEPMCCWFESSRGFLVSSFRNISVSPPGLRDWVINGLGMYSSVYATGHIKDPVPLIEKRRGLSPGGRFPPSFIHQVIIITGLNKLYNRMFSL